MSMSHRRVINVFTPTGGEDEREEACNEPAVETQNARLEQVGAFIVGEVAASRSASAMGYQQLDEDVATGFCAGRPGKVVGVVAQALGDDCTAVIGAGSMTFNASIGGVAVGDALVLDKDHLKRVVIFATPVDFATLDDVGVLLATSSTLLPDGQSNAVAWPLVRWTPKSDDQVDAA